MKKRLHLLVLQAAGNVLRDKVEYRWRPSRRAWGGWSGSQAWGGCRVLTDVRAVQMGLGQLQQAARSSFDMLHAALHAHGIQGRQGLLAPLLQEPDQGQPHGGPGLFSNLPPPGMQSGGVSQELTQGKTCCGNVSETYVARCEIIFSLLPAFSCSYYPEIRKEFFRGTCEMKST